uniref:Cytochrome c oxidase subunit 2 n=1 Tax=Rhinusa pilosa TaxID=1218928 RepID=A0A0B4MZA6_9CUCU|nr:cytochrome c oxidase subunit II [Rhinusa pilosa]AID45822.1 cytochrome c oxidase subunit II [Rhinusa pilosa]AID45824.1 cytochrome c oxidase subunit II [Rhinusa pilosa]AID45825.1 cytochrome c oxidase subunit II [Rhinusa pilosa]
MATWKTLLMQDSASPLMEQLIYFHDHTMTITVIIMIIVSHVIMSMMLNKFTHRFLLEGQLIETIWTILPAIILTTIALPSLRLLYILDEVYNPVITVKVIGHQWFWSYEYSDYKNLEFDSYMTPNNLMSKSNFRLLDVDNRMIVPFNTQIRVIVTSMDVIHSWAVPALGVKIDATPGRLNQANFNINRTSLFYGQCSEICGANHSFMPIVIETVSTLTFISWMNSMNNY